MVEANRTYVQGFRHGDLASPPTDRVAVVTCMDARMDPAAMLGLQPGQAHVIRNAGGDAGEALRSLVLSQQLLGTNAVAVIKHTRCGMHGLADATVEERLAAAGIASPGIAWRGFDDLEQAVRDDVALLRASPLIAAETVRGFVYDVTSGALTEVA